MTSSSHMGLFSVWRLASDADGRVLGVYRLPHVVQTRGAEDDAARAREAGEGEEQQEEAVQHHRDVLPVLHHLVVLVVVADVLGDELNSCQCHLHLGAEAVRGNRVL